MNGAPCYITNREGELVWRDDITLNGPYRMRQEGFNALPIHQQVDWRQMETLRYQGQYRDQESGLHYNTFRYFDPSLGRFSQPDPIGLAGGWNLYQYAPNPFSWVDPWGWCFVSRRAAFRQIKRDLGIPQNQQPDNIVDPSSGLIKQYRKVAMTDRVGKPILGQRGRPVMTTEYQFSLRNGSKIIVQDHSAGHAFAGGIGNQGPHFNVRPADNTRTGKIPSTKGHYSFNVSTDSRKFK